MSIDNTFCSFCTIIYISNLKSEYLISFWSQVKTKMRSCFCKMRWNETKMKSHLHEMRLIFHEMRWDRIRMRALSCEMRLRSHEMRWDKIRIKASSCKMKWKFFLQDEMRSNLCEMRASDFTSSQNQNWNETRSW